MTTIPTHLSNAIDRILEEADTKRTELIKVEQEANGLITEICEFVMGQVEGYTYNRTSKRFEPVPSREPSEVESDGQQTDN